MTIGSELRNARLRAGLSVKQLADRTKVKLQKIEALEKSDFEYLPRGIYLDGVVKAYAQEVGFDAKLAMQRVREEIAEADESTWISQEAPAGPQQKEGTTKQTRPKVAPLAAVPARADAEIRNRPPSAVVAATAGLSPPPRLGRRALVITVLGLLAAVGFAAYLSSLTRPTPVTRPNGGVATGAQSAASDKAVAVDREGASLVRDAPARAIGGDSRAAMSPAAPVTPPGTAEPSGAARGAGDLPPEPVAIPSVSSTGITGTWDLTTQVESTTMEGDQGRRHGYRIEFRQDGQQIRGTGYRVTENGATVAQTPITLHGTIDGRELVLTFTEQGAQGTRSGRFVLNLGADLALRGSFQSDAAKSRGSINARRRR